jgi:hypothetical protein
MLTVLLTMALFTVVSADEPVKKRQTQNNQVPDGKCIITIAKPLAGYVNSVRTEAGDTPVRNFSVNGDKFPLPANYKGTVLLITDNEEIPTQIVLRNGCDGDTVIGAKNVALASLNFMRMAIDPKAKQSMACILDSKTMEGGDFKSVVSEIEAVIKKSTGQPVTYRGTHLTVEASRQLALKCAGERTK